MLPLAADVRAAAAHVNIRGRDRNGLLPPDLTSVGGETHARIGHQAASRFDIQEGGGPRILATASGRPAEDLHAIHFHTATAGYLAGTIVGRGLATGGNG